MMSAPSSFIAVGVKSSGSTDIPPVKMSKSAPMSMYFLAACKIIGRLSSQILTPKISLG
ncbi:hypothetical protein EVA_17347 [gut metagenome]|uniref:Uncharacterized protein n=1 Tax=gut metagenome TaxID=749906 RepID=J9FI54_9ZZZZ